jgi:hypothetical protein
VAGGLSGLVGGILGVNNPSTAPYGNSADEAKRQQLQYGAREAGNYNQEQSLASGLQSQINGTAGPSVAQTQLRAGLDQNNAAAMSAGAGSTGVNSVLARYQARQGQGEQGAMLQQQAAQLRAQEVAQYLQQLQQLHAAMGGQSIGLYGANMQAGLGYDQLKAQMDQQNAQRDTILGAAGLQGASQLGAGLSSAFGGGGPGTNPYGGAPMDYTPARM